MLKIKTIIVDDYDFDHEVNLTIDLPANSVGSIMKEIKAFYKSLNEQNKNLIGTSELALVLGVSTGLITSMSVNEGMPFTNIKRGNSKTYDIYELENYFRAIKPKYYDKYKAWLDKHDEKAK